MQRFSSGNWYRIPDMDGTYKFCGFSWGTPVFVDVDGDPEAFFGPDISLLPQILELTNG